MGIEDELPGLPEPVGSWLSERASYLGWPPSGREWFGVLRGRSLSEWQQLRWEKRTVSLQFEALTNESMRVILGLIQANFGGVENEYSALDCSRGKFADIVRYMTAHHRLPGQLLFLEDDGRLEIVDGCHRLTVFFMLRRAGVREDELGSEYEAWVGVV